MWYHACRHNVGFLSVNASLEQIGAVFRAATARQNAPAQTGKAEETQGYTNQAIAEKLVISPKTVRNHISSIFSKSQVTSRLEAILRAKDAGLT